jgi:hypothetical protein
MCRTEKVKVIIIFINGWDKKNKNRELIVYIVHIIKWNVTYVHVFKWFLMLAMWGHRRPKQYKDLKKSNM